MITRKRPKFGDIIEIKTKEGLVYGLYSHDNKYRKFDLGSLLRILPGFHQKEPSDFNELVRKPEQFSVSLYLPRPIRLGKFRIVENVPLPDWAKPFPLLRSTSLPNRDGAFEYWYICDGDSVERVPWNSERVRHLSESGFCNEIYLITQLEKHYSPEGYFLETLRRNEGVNWEYEGVKWQ